MQVQFVLHGVLAALEPLEHPRRQILAPVAGRIASLQGTAVAQQPGEFTARVLFILLGHPRARFRPRRGRRRRDHLAQRLDLADGSAEQRSGIFVFRM